MHASSVVAIFYLAAGIAPSFAAPMLSASLTPLLLLMFDSVL